MLCSNRLFLRRESVRKPQTVGFLSLKAQAPGENSPYKGGMEA